jgi:hypothetical protein
MTLLRAFVVAALATSAATAHAQPATRDHRAPAPAPKAPAARPSQDVVVRLSITSWGPKTARAGETVTLEGKALSDKVEVLLAGKPIRARFEGGALRFVVPPRYGDAEIRLRKPGVADDVVVGVLRIEADPEIHQLAPTSGSYGTRVEIRGQGFAKGDELRMGGRALPASDWSGDRVVVTIPEWARTDAIALYRGGAERARSKKPFVVQPPAPIVSSVTPPSGPPGTVVRLGGSGFDTDDQVSYGKKPMAVVGRGDGWVEARIPDKARRDETIFVRGDGGVASSPREFHLELPATIAEVRPSYGAPGSQFTIRGAGFLAGDLVFLGGKKADIVQLRDRELVATVPYGTGGGDVVVRRGASDVKARRPFEVVNLPTLTGFVPTKGEAGTRVTLSGTWLVDPRVWYGAVRLKPVRADGKTVEVVVPKGAGDQKFRVATRGGEATSAKAFELLVYGAIADARPRRVSPGDKLELRGPALDHITKISLGAVELPVVEQRRGATIVSIPEGARSGKLAWVSHGRRAETSFELTVLVPPSIAGFQPDYGAPKGQVIVRGKNFDDATRLFYGDVPMKIVKRSAYELVAQVPDRGRGKEYLWVQGEGPKVRSASLFSIMLPPAIRNLTPTRGTPGTRVTVRGDGFDTTTEILFGAWRAAVLERAGDDAIVVEVPKGKPGDWEVTAKSGPLSSTWSARFAIVAPPPPPPRAPNVRDHRDKEKGAGGVDVRDHRGEKPAGVAKPSEKP